MPCFTNFSWGNRLRAKFWWIKCTLQIFSLTHCGKGLAEGVLSCKSGLLGFMLHKDSRPPSPTDFWRVLVWQLRNNKLKMMGPKADWDLGPTVMPAVIAVISQFSWAVREQLQTNQIGWKCSSLLLLWKASWFILFEAGRVLTIGPSKK